MTPVQEPQHSWGFGAAFQDLPIKEGYQSFFNLDILLFLHIVFFSLLLRYDMHTLKYYKHANLKCIYSSMIFTYSHIWAHSYHTSSSLLALLFVVTYLICKGQ